MSSNKKLTHRKRNLLKGMILIGFLISVLNSCKTEKAKPDYYLTKATVKEIRWTSSGQNAVKYFTYVFKNKEGDSIEKNQNANRTDKIFVGQEFDLKVDSNNSDVLELDLSRIN